MIIVDGDAWESAAWLDAQRLELESAGRQDVGLHVAPDLPKGLHRIIIEAHAPNDQVERFAVEHYSPGN